MAAIPGARVKLFFDGTKEVGFATGLRVTEDQGLMRIDTLGEIYSREIVPVGRTVVMEADVVVLNEATIRKLGLLPRGGTLEALVFPPMTAQVVDRVTGDIIYQLDGVVFERQTWRVEARSVMTLNATFQAIRVTDSEG